MSATLQDVLITEALAERPTRPPDLPAENAALSRLAALVPRGATALVEGLLDEALRLCRAGSAGVSLLEKDGQGAERFRWIVIRGALAQWQGQNAPRDFSPCGACLDRGAAQLLSRPARHFTYLAASPVPVEEVLVLPFAAEGGVLGAVWVVAHDAHRFDREDARLLATLGAFTAAAFTVGAAADTLRLQVKREQEANRRKDEFLAMLAHELRNPLAPMSAAVAMLERHAKEADSVLKYTKVVDRQLRHMRRLVDDLLDVGRVTTGKIALEPLTVDLADIVRQAAASVGARAAERRHRFSIQLPHEPSWVSGDPIRLEQAVVNVLANAIQYSPPDSTTDVVLAVEGNEVTLRVRDRGVGILPEALPFVFDLFYQAGQPIDRNESGLGVGLALVRSVVELHGGTVFATSAGAGAGAEFILRLPRTGEAIARPALQTIPEVTAHGRLRILIVEDHPDASEMLRDILDDWGHDTEVAADGETAVQLALHAPPDVILLDLGLPKLDGFQVAETLRRADRLSNTHVIALTGYGQDFHREKAKQAGIDEHLLKPVDIDLLRKLLTVAAKGPRQAPRA